MRVWVSFWPYLFAQPMHVASALLFRFGMPGVRFARKVDEKIIIETTRKWKNENGSKKFDSKLEGNWRRGVS